MITDTLLPILQDRFPGKGILGCSHSEPCITFPAKHPDVGDIQIVDDGVEITIYVGNFTHSHFSNYDDISDIEKEREISADVADFLERLFSDRVILWGSHKEGGGWKDISPDEVDEGKRENEFLWSGPK